MTRHKLAIIMNENKKLRGDLASAQAEVKRLQEQVKKQKKKVENILPYCVINKQQTLGNGASTSSQPPIIPAHHPILKLVVAKLTEKQKQVVSETKKKQWVSFRDKTNMVIS